MRNKIVTALVLLVLAAGSMVAMAKAGRRSPGAAVGGHIDAPPVIQLAILLDTSNSMDGLIDQARGQLWKIVNDFAAARRAGRPARLEVALYEYGNTRLSPASGWIRRVLPFTSDLDRVSEELFALRTSGGDEYCGMVLQTALDELAWSNGASDLKVVFIAGNEPFTQGPVDFRPVCRRARERGIVVNTIHCGPADEGARTGWREGAMIADGAYNVIDQNRMVEHIDAPQDGEIARLGAELNKTYVPYGAVGKESQARQETQDKNAQKVGVGSAVSRALTKANRLYSNSGWDLVDAVKQKQTDPGKMKSDELPAEMQKLGPEERKAYVLGKAKERERLQVAINKLNEARAQYVAAAEAKKASAAGKDDTLDVAVARTLREQAARRGMELK